MLKENVKKAKTGTTSNVYMILFCSVQPALSKNQLDNQICLLKIGAFLILVHFNVFACLGNVIQ